MPVDPSFENMQAPAQGEKGKERDGDHGEESHRMEGEKQGGEGGHVEKKFKRDTDSEFLPSSLE